MRLIDADALADALFDKRKAYPQWVAETIGNMPDAVIRCKDCKHRYDNDQKCPYCNECGRREYPPDDWFCADGGRLSE